MRHAIFFIKLVHSLFFLFQSVCIGIVLYSAVADKITTITWIALVSVLCEGVVLCISGWKCPLTTYTERLEASSGSVTDIFLPKWFAEHTFSICGAVFGLACLLLLLRLMV